MLAAKNVLRGELVVLARSSGVLCNRCLSVSSQHFFLDDLLLRRTEGNDGMDTIPASLTAALNNASSQRELLDLLEDAGSECHLRHLVTATERLSDLRPQCLTDSIYTPDDGLYRLEGRLCSRSEKLSPLEVCTVLKACSRMALALPNNDLLAGLCLQFRCTAEWLNAEQLAECLHSLAILRSRTVMILESYNVLCIVEEQLLARVSDLQPSALAKAVWSMHRLMFRSDELWAALARHTARLSASMESTWLTCIAKCYAEHCGPLRYDSKLKTSVEAMLHRSTAVLLSRHETKSQFSCLSGMLWACSVVRWPTPRLAAVVADEVQRVSLAGTTAPVTWPTVSPFIIGPWRAPSTKKTWRERKADTIGFEQQGSLLSWALGKTSATLGSMLKSSKSLDDAPPIVDSCPAIQTMGLPLPVSCTSNRSAERSPWMAVAAVEESQSPEASIGSLHRKRCEREDKRAPTDSADKSSTRPSTGWLGIDGHLGESESTNLLKSLSTMSCLRIPQYPQGLGQHRSSAISNSADLVQQLQHVLEEQRKAKAAKKIGEGLSSIEKHQQQMQILWPASRSPFAQRLEWFGSPPGCEELVESPSLTAGIGLKQLPATLVMELSQVMVLWKESMLSDHSPLPTALHEELYNARHHQTRPQCTSPILTPVSDCIKALGLPCRHAVSLDCYDIDIVSDIPSTLLKDPAMTSPMSLAVVLTDLANYPERHSPGFMVLLRRYLQTRHGKDWRLCVIDVGEWNRWGSADKRREMLRERLNGVLW